MGSDGVVDKIVSEGEKCSALGGLECYGDVPKRDILWNGCLKAKNRKLRQKKWEAKIIWFWMTMTEQWKATTVLYALSKAGGLYDRGRSEWKQSYDQV